MKRILPVALALLVVASVAAAQQAVPPWGLSRDAPAVFRTEPYVATITVDDGDGLTRWPGMFPRDPYVLIDKRYRLPLTFTARSARRTTFRFTPHDVLLDGKTHRVEFRYGALTKTYEMTFPRPTRR